MALQAEKAAEQLLRYERLKGTVRTARQGEEPAEFVHALAPLASSSTFSSSSSSSNASSLPYASSSLASPASDSPLNGAKSCLMESNCQNGHHVPRKESLQGVSPQQADQTVRASHESAEALLAVLASAPLPLASLDPPPTCDPAAHMVDGEVDGDKGSEPLPCTLVAPELVASPTTSQPRHRGGGLSASGPEPSAARLGFHGASEAFSFDAVEVGDLPMLEVCATRQACAQNEAMKAWDIREVSVGSEDSDVVVAAADVILEGSEEVAIPLSVTCRSEYDGDYDLFDRVLAGKGVGLPARCASDTMAGRQARARGWLEGSKSQVVGGLR